jgi:hypothetical protein
MRSSSGLRGAGILSAKRRAIDVVSVSKFGQIKALRP